MEVGFWFVSHTNSYQFYFVFSDKLIYPQREIIEVMGMPQIATSALKKEVSLVLKQQGYSVSNGSFFLKNNELQEKRGVHKLAKAARIIEKENFLTSATKLIESHLINGKDLDIEKIDPTLIEVKAGSEEEKLFRWWNVAWWSLPYERAYGRQMRFVVWDQYHDAPIGLIGLQSPILNWGPRDKYLGIIPEERDFWVNQSLSAQRLGALPPYNDILGGKLVSMLMTADIVRRKFRNKYKDQKTILEKRVLPPNLLFITTTGAYGKSSVYNRLRFNDETVAKFIGYTQGNGTFHIPNALYEDMMEYLEQKGYEVKRGFGNGPSRKLRLIDTALQELGFANGKCHGVKRALYLFPLVKNLEDVIQKRKRLKWNHRTIPEMTEFWKERWAFRRAENKKEYLKFNGEKFIKETLSGVEKYKELLVHHE